MSNLSPQDKLRRQIADYLVDVPEQYTKSVNYVMCKEGVRVVRHTPLGDFVQEATNIPYLESLPTGVFLSVPKVPYEYICQIYSFFKFICKRDKTEVSALIFWDPAKQEHFIHIPKQTNSGGGSDFSQDQETKDFRMNMIPVMELHSHNTMGAFFSSTDDANENFSQYYMVMGKLDAKSEYKIRYACGGVYTACNLFDIVKKPSLILHISNTLVFDMPFDSDFLMEGMDFPQEWLDKLEKRAVFVSRGTAGSYVHPVMSFGSDVLSGEEAYQQELDLLQKEDKKKVTEEPTSLLSKSGESLKGVQEIQEERPQTKSLESKMNEFRNRINTTKFPI